VLTTSCQSTAVFAEAVIVFPVRAILTAGITRETSPARWLGVSGAATTSPGMLNIVDKRNARPQAYGDFIFRIGDSPEFNAAMLFVTGAFAGCQFDFPTQFPMRYFARNSAR
jgi:hypothetical protein